MTTVSPEELARRARRHGVRIDARLARSFLVEWRAQGIAHELLPGRWRLTEKGAAMFSGWAAELELDEELVA